MPRPRDVDSLIADVLRAAADGRIRDPGGRRYERDELHALRGALSHVSFRLGTRDAEGIRDADIHALIDDLRQAGLPPARLDAVEEATHLLFDHAERHPPVPGAAPTLAVLAVAEHAVTWMARAMVIVFVVVAVGLVVLVA